MLFLLRAILIYPSRPHVVPQLKQIRPLRIFLRSNKPVLYEPIVAAIFHAVTNHEHTVVQLSLAALLLHIETCNPTSHKIHETLEIIQAWNFHAT